MSQWQSMEMLSRRPWVPSRGRQSFNFRPHCEPVGRPQPFSLSSYGNYGQINKSRDYCYLTPYYRNVMPPPPPPQGPPTNPNKDRLLMVDPSRKKGSKKSLELSPCQCKSKSLDDVRMEVASDWEDDENGNKVISRRKKINMINSKLLSNNNKKMYNRRSMDNLLIDTNPQQGHPYGVFSKHFGKLQVSILQFKKGTLLWQLSGNNWGQI